MNLTDRLSQRETELVSQVIPVLVHAILVILTLIWLNQAL